MTLDISLRCPKCGNSLSPCMDCNGSGVMKVPSELHGEISVKCKFCSGSGKHCVACQIKAFEEVDRMLNRDTQKGQPGIPRNKPTERYTGKDYWRNFAPLSGRNLIDKIVNMDVNESPLEIFS